MVVAFGRADDLVAVIGSAEAVNVQVARMRWTYLVLLPQRLAQPTLEFSHKRAHPPIELKLSPRPER